MTDLPDLNADGARIGIVTSGSDTGEVLVDLIGNERVRSVNGHMVVLRPIDAQGRTEIALGTVTKVEVSNRYHEDKALRGVIALRGGIGNLTARGDVKTATVSINSAFREENGRLRPIGGALSFAPNTGEAVVLAEKETVDRIATETTDDLFYLGTIYRQPHIPLPMSVHDFSDARGAEGAGFFGASGSGKTFTATRFLASQMRHKRMAFLLIDPQGQFSSSSRVTRELPLDLRALAELQGREVHQLSVAREVRLPKDAQMFVDMLDGAKWFGSTAMLGATSKSDDAKTVMLNWLSEVHKGWDTGGAETLLTAAITYFADRAGHVFASDGPRDRFEGHMRDLIDGKDPARWKTLLRTLEAFHSMFTEHGPGGVTRVPIVDIAKALTTFDIGTAGARKAAPFYLLVLAGDVAGPGGEDTEVVKALSRTETQAVILRTLFAHIEGQARWQYSEGRESANLLIAMDEAARYTSDAGEGTARAIASDMARYFRELRKYGVGFTLILQEPSSMHDSIWKQMRNGFRAFAGGLVGNDFDRVREQVGDADAMNLYRQLAQPSKDNPVYPWMLCGAFSPLAATASPVFMESFTSNEAWVAENSRWLPPLFNVSDVWRPRRR